MITSRNHPQIRAFRRLLARKGRQDSGSFIAEGIRQVTTLIESSYVVETLIVAPDLLASATAWDVVARHRSGGGTCLMVSADVFASISVRENPQGLAAVASSGIRRLDEVDASTRRLWVALIDPQDPGNVGTIARTCDAVGAAGIILIGNAVDPYHPRSIRASVGAVFTQEIVTCSGGDLVAWSRANELPLVGTSDTADLDYRQLPSTREMVLVMGSERQGIPDAMRTHLDSVVRIPMSGSCDSLNLAVATSVILYEIAYGKARREAV